MPCKVCGSTKTVRSHLLPRAFIKAVKGTHQIALQGSVKETGTILTQSGEFDSDLLCDAHEKALQCSDNYAVKWVRGFAKNATLRTDLDSVVYVVPNPRPDLLLHFVCSVVWRHAASQRFGPANGVDLGPWEPKLRGMIFHGVRYNPAFRIAKRDLTIGDQIVDPPIIFSPHKNDDRGRNGWDFEVGGFIWSLKLDDRRKGEIPEIIKANRQNPVPVLNYPPLPAVDRTGFIEALANMDQPSKTVSTRSRLPTVQST